ncbi:MAG: RecQ family ATP-dependent DNA helicase [Prevotella shahii]|jgi:ATP-dependent DNA helicase, recQ family|uniref:RecQ family ATP-dependent DNA helicase n=1 Tax=Hoylesella shahii TaxID=228603 RepID=UPI001CAD52FD|nr:ATP-dependent DNA helicase RecQ [Hoylesella shahii]MBF1590593.1 RecQ family ATP-dependent DNA helicase [Hoylesella shahii]
MEESNGALNANDAFRQTLREYWGYPDFRGIQRDIIESISQGKDTLGLMPTGGGKSITFQVPALVMPGVCVVITPLIALMKDQVDHLRQKGIQAAAIYSGMSRREIITTLENCIFGGIKLLYVSPERLFSDIFKVKFKHMDVSFVTVDEAHCISQWGYDFRPSYLSIAEIRQLKPDTAILALTATATPRVIDDIQERLGFKQKNVFRMSFERSNLAYIVRETMDKYTELIHILNAVSGSAIVYVRSRKHASDMAQFLTSENISATFYHAGLEPVIKNQRQNSWQQNEVRVIVATNAFGMGIDKPDVRLVLHIDCPDSIEAYFQEAGRAGRDGKKAYAVLLWNKGDRKKLNKRVAENFPEKDYIKEVYEDLAYYYQIGVGSGAGYSFVFEIDKFSRTFKHFPVQTHSALQILERAGYIHYEMEPEARARVMFKLGRNDLYRLDESSKFEDAVITALLRTYGGLFSNYVYIDEGLVAQEAGLTTQQVYVILKNLAQRNIIYFIPQRKTPFITYLQDRIDGEKVVLSKEIYEERKEQYVKRINAMQAYASNNEVCRSRQLLIYFGEKRHKDCEQCDVCLDHESPEPSNEQTKNAREAILNLLKDGERHHITELHKLNLPNKGLDVALEYLIHEEEINIDGSFIFL